METLSKLFGSENKVKMMRLFLFNPEKVFGAVEVADRIKAEPSKIRKELVNLEKMNLIKRKAGRVKGGQGFVLDSQFVYMEQLANFLINIEPLHPKEIINKVSKLGSVKLIVIAGVFIQETESRVDMLVVGDGVKKSALENVIKLLESEIGKELKYAQFTTEEFKYRLSMCDKLTRDILDYPHRKVLNKLGNI
ncbi:MAG: hypothetical protein V4690_04090 [Patescibacteria group bacterium]